MEDLKKLITDAKRDFTACKSLTELDNAKSKYLGKAGPITEAMKGLSKLSKEEKPKIGALINEVKQGIELALIHCKESIQKQILTKQLSDESILSLIHI